MRTNPQFVMLLITLFGKPLSNVFERFTHITPNGFGIISWANKKHTGFDVRGNVLLTVGLRSSISSKSISKIT
jgi:hypothetical protein